jgi:predicted negative regulator of RcsB-dependent stress response
LLDAGKPDEALIEAQRAVELAPNAVACNVALGDVLAALNRQPEARTQYEHALQAAQTIHPEFQVGWVSSLQKKLAGPKS